MFGTENEKNIEKEFALEKIRNEISYLTDIAVTDNIQHDLVLLDKIIDFVEKNKSLLDLKYAEDIWYIMAKLYHLKTMITNMHIYKSYEVRREINEIIEYANKHLVWGC